MLKIGDREVTVKDIALAGILLLVAIAAVWAMVGSKPKPIISQAPPSSATGLVLLQGGQPGAGPGQFNYPRGVAVDSQGDIYVADSRNHRIQKFSGNNWQLIEEFGGFFNLGGGDEKKLENTAPGKLNEPNGIAIGPDDMVYVMDTWNGRVQVFSPKGKPKSIFKVDGKSSGSITTADDGFFGPREVVADANGFVYVADTGKHRIVKFDPKGKKIRAWGTKGDKKGEFNEPIGLALDQAGNLYVADRLNFRIQVFNTDGQFLKEWPVDGWSKEQIDMEPHLALDQAHGLLYATDGRAKKVYCYHLDGKLAGTYEKDSAGNNLFMAPIGVAVDKSGNVYVMDAAVAKLFKLKGQF
jgi:DNA-binding beta-propeller fold protein YncE